MVWKMKLSEDEDRSWKLNRVIISYKGRVSLIALEMFICVPYSEEDKNELCNCT